MKAWIAAVVVIAVWLIWPRPADPLPGFPRVFVWAWERPEDLQFIDPHSTGIAFLARTVCLCGGSVSLRPRLQPMRYPPGAVLMAVVRVETHGPLPPVDDAAGQIAEAAAIPGVRALQIDFDALRSQREYYRSLLQRIRGRMPPGMPLSMTALTSWCESDGWIAGLPVAEAVPMLFRMGKGEQPARSFRLALCRSSAGVSVDEPLHEPPSAGRLYLFNPRPWTATSFQAALREARRWH